LPLPAGPQALAIDPWVEVDSTEVFDDGTLVSNSNKLFESMVHGLIPCPKTADPHDLAKKSGVDG